MDISRRRSKHDIWVEHREKRVEISAARSGEEGVDNFSLPGEIAIANRRRSLHSAACTARELPCGVRRAFHDGSDLIERHAKHVMQHESEPLRWRQRIEYHEQREADRVGQERFTFGVAAAHNRLRQRLLAPRLARAQHVQADARDDGRQPSAKVLDAARVSAAELQPRLLDSVLRLGQ